MTIRMGWFLIALLILSSARPVYLTAVEAKEEVDAGVVRYGVTHNIAEDRVVQKIGGIYEPEGLDKYMKRKFDEIHAKIDTMQEKLTAIESDIKAMKPKPNA